MNLDGRVGHNILEIRKPSSNVASSSFNNPPTAYPISAPCRTSGEVRPHLDYYLIGGGFFPNQ